MKLRDIRPEDFHVVANLGHRADGRARALDGIALLDGDGGRNAFDAIDPRLVHAVEELAGVGGKCFNVPALPFGEQRVKRERAFAGPAQTRDHNEPVAWQIQVEILQVVLAHAAEANHRMGGPS